MCVNLNFKLHPEKFRLYRRSIIWCGRNISAEVVRYHPRNLQGLEDMDTPLKAIKLLHFTSALQWMRTSIPKFSALLKALIGVMAYAKAGKRTKRAILKIIITGIGWQNYEPDVFKQCKEALRCRVRLLLSKKEKRLCFYVDAYDSH